MIMAENNNSAKLGFENKLWEIADMMRGHMDSGEYENVVLGLIFLKYRALDYGQ
jgi:type I restriction enzyme M protein